MRTFTPYRENDHNKKRILSIVCRHQFILSWCNVIGIAHMKNKEKSYQNIHKFKPLFLSTLLVVHSRLAVKAFSIIKAFYNYAPVTWCFRLIYGSLVKQSYNTLPRFHIFKIDFN